MPDWKDIAKLSDREARTREAQFEAEMLALIAQGESPAPTASPTPSATTLPASTLPIRDGVQISVTANGQTAHYNNLEAVPAPVRQQIMSAWIASPSEAVPPVLNAPAVRNILPTPSSSARRPKTMKVAMFLNLMVPGAGQFYLGQRLAGAVYALAFLACFATALGIFLHGYFDYLRLSTSGDILESSILEQLAHAFPAGTIAGLSIIGIVIYLVSAVHLAVSRAGR